MNNEVEVDEVYIGGKIRNDKNKPNAQGRSTKYKTPIFGMVERNGKLNAKKVNNAQCSTLLSNIVKYVKDTATIYSDDMFPKNTFKFMLMNLCLDTTQER